MKQDPQKVGLAGTKMLKVLEFKGRVLMAFKCTFAKKRDDQDSVKLELNTDNHCSI